eukprot:7388378-Lingulodinium_polyedra.AAC.1
MVPSNGARCSRMVWPAGSPMVWLSGPALGVAAALACPTVDELMPPTSPPPASTCSCTRNAK